MKRLFTDFIIFSVLVFVILFFLPKPEPIVRIKTVVSAPDTVRVLAIKMDMTKVDSLKHKISVIARKLYRVKRQRDHIAGLSKMMQVKLDSVYDQYRSIKVLKSNYGQIKVTSFGLTPADSIKIAYQLDINKAYLEMHPRYLGLNKREWTIAGIGIAFGVVGWEFLRK